MRAELLEVFVLAAVTVALHDVLVTTVTRVLVAHKAGDTTQYEEVT